MTVVQTSYDIDPAVAKEGDLADYGGVREIVTRFATATLSPGRFVAWDVSGDANDAEVPAATEQVTDNGAFGVVVREETREADDFEAGEAVGVLRKGRIWVHTEQDVDPNDPVFVRFDSGAGGTVLGRFRKDDDTATAVECPHMRWRSVSTGGGLALLEVDLP